MHLTIGVCGNALFFVGSVLFLTQRTQRIGVRAFIVGSFLVLISAVGKSLVRYVDAEP